MRERRPEKPAALVYEIFNIDILPSQFFREMFEVLFEPVLAFWFCSAMKSVINLEMCSA